MLCAGAVEPKENLGAGFDPSSLPSPARRLFGCDGCDDDDDFVSSFWVLFREGARAAAGDEPKSPGAEVVESLVACGVLVTALLEEEPNENCGGSAPNEGAEAVFAVAASADFAAAFEPKSKEIFLSSFAGAGAGLAAAGALKLKPDFSSLPALGGAAAGAGVVLVAEGAPNEKPPPVAAGAGVVLAAEAAPNEKPPPLAAGAGVVLVVEGAPNEKPPPVPAGAGVVLLEEGAPNEKPPLVAALVLVLAGAPNVKPLPVDVEVAEVVGAAVFDGPVPNEKGFVLVLLPVVVAVAADGPAATEVLPSEPGFLVLQARHSSCFIST